MNTEKRNLNETFKSLFETKYKDNVYKNNPWFIEVKYQAYRKKNNKYVIEYVAIDGDCVCSPYHGSISIDYDDYE